MNIRPFSWESVESVPRNEVHALRALRRWIAPHLCTEGFASAIGTLLGRRVETRLRRIQPMAKVPPFGDGLGVIFVDGDGTGAGATLLEAETAAVTALVAPIVRREHPTVLRPSAPDSAALAGAFAAILSAAARRAHGHSYSPFRVLATGSVAQLESDLDCGDLLCATFTVIVEDEAYAARLLVPRQTVMRAPAVPWNGLSLRGLGMLPLAIPVVACAVPIATGDIAALRVGDALMPGDWPLAHNEGGEWVGPVCLAAPCSENGVRAQLVDVGHVVLRGEGQRLSTAEVEMARPEETPELVAALGDIPVLVRVEIGEARLAAREWASLGRGDVIALGRRIGDGVLLRVGGVPMARGELVEIEGEVGVRIVDRLDDQTAT